MSSSDEDRRGTLRPRWRALLWGIVLFLLSAAALGWFLDAFQRYRRWIPLVERVAGVLLVVVGVLVYTNYFLVLNAWALSLTPDWLLRRL